jgi:outer membrane protein, heavy metal efflux system
MTLVSVSRLRGWFAFGTLAPALALPLAARGASPAAFGRHCIPSPPQCGCRIEDPVPGSVASLLNVPDLPGRRALAAGRDSAHRAPGATPELHRGLPGSIAAVSAQEVRPSPGLTARPVPLTIDRAVGEALEHNLNLLAERFNVTVADAAVLTASLKPNPVITASVMRPDAVLVDAGISPHEQVFRTDYVIERGGKRDRRVDQATVAKSVAELQLLNTTRSLVLDVEGAFTDVQLAKLNLALAQDNLKAFNDVVQVNAERVRTGDLSPVELSRSRLAALQFQNDVRQQETRLRTARNRLSTLIGRGPNGEAVDVSGDLRKDVQPIDLDALQRQALRSRPDLRAAREDRARSVADLRLQLANGTIDYTVSGEYHRQEGAAVQGNSYGVFFSAPLPIFNRNQGEIARARAQQEQLQTKVLAAETQVSSEVANAYAEYSTAREIVDVIEGQMLTQAQSVRTTMEYSYRRGEASFVEFLDAVRAFNETMQSYNEARAGFARSLYTIDSISGRVNP